MEKKENDDKLQIWQSFAEYIRSNGSDPDLRCIHNPIYSTLSEQLKKPKDEIRKTILEMQPYLFLTQLRYSKYIFRFIFVEKNLNCLNLVQFVLRK